MVSEEDVENTLMFSLVARKSRTFKLVSVQEHKEQRGSTARTADLNHPEGCSMPQTSCSVYKPAGVGREGQITAQASGLDSNGVVHCCSVSRGLLLPFLHFFQLLLSSQSFIITAIIIF